MQSEDDGGPGESWASFSSYSEKDFEQRVTRTDCHAVRITLATVQRKGTGWGPCYSPQNRGCWLELQWET